MFEEVEFDDDDGKQNESSAGEVGGGSNRKTGGHSPTMMLRFHQPGEEAFCAVAGSQYDTEDIQSARLVNGDSWVTQECRCARCEGMRVVAKMDGIETSRRQRGIVAPLLLVLLDLDNFGFNQLKSVAPRLPEESDSFKLVDNIFVWSFFGSCFTRYHKIWPSEESVALPFTPAGSSKPPPAQSSASPRRPSVWQQLVGGGQVHFTPCTGASQGADNVIKDVIRSFTPLYHVVLVTGDVQMINEIRPESARTIGRKTARIENEEEFSSGHLDIINVKDCGHRFLSVWMALMRTLQMSVSSA